MSFQVWGVFRGTFGPLLNIGRKTDNVPAANSFLSDEAVTQQKYEELWKDYNNLKATFEKFHEDYDKLAMIRSQLPRSFGAMVLAQVIGTMGDNRHELVINKGRDDGVKDGQYVLSAAKNSVVGVVQDVTERHAILRVITNRNQSIEIRILNEPKKRNIPGQMFGNGKSACHIQLIEKERQVEVGDAVFAAAQPGRLNVPVVVGIVVRVEPDDQYPLLWDITVQPAEDTAHLNEVAVIIGDDFTQED